ncbi:MAG: DNA methyltransferase [Planctomycetota bacterium]
MAGSRVQLVHGDSLKELPTLADGQAKLVLTDPPYGIGYRDHAGRDVANDDRPFIWWLAEAYRVTASRGALFCFCRWDVQEIFRLAIEAAGYTVRSQVVWVKRGGGQGDTRTQASPSHEVAWLATKGKFRFPGKRLDSVLEARPPHANVRTHPTEKPVPLLRTILESTTVPGDLVVDPFAGTGSSAVAAARTHRRFWGCELEEHYVSVARMRVASVC